MNAQNTPETVQPPRVIEALRSGFEIVAHNIGLIIFPIVLDVFLWLGPHFQIKSEIQALTVQMNAALTDQTTEIQEAMKTVMTYMADHFNLAIALRSYPIGIPSLMATRIPLETPFGLPLIISVDNSGWVFLAWVLFSILGIILGGIYFYWIGFAVNGNHEGHKVGHSFWAIFQTILLSVCWFVFFLTINIPAMLLLATLVYVSPGIAELATILYMIMMAWIIMPLFFSPHGIHYFGQNAISSILTSMRLVRYVLPGTSMFVMVAILISRTLDYLWESPTSDSWMTVVGIAGHAFISTAIVASSFYYYRDSLRWVQDFLQRRILPTSGVAKV